MPIVVICGQVPTAAIGSDAFQEAPVANIMGAVAKHCFLVTDPTRLEATMRTAFEIARTGRPGAGRDRRAEGRAELAAASSRAPGTCPCAAIASAWRSCSRAALDEARCAEFFAMLGEAKRPLIYAGGGVIHGNAAHELRALRERSRHPGRHDADGHRCVRHDASALDAHARHARRGVRELRGRRLRFPDRARRALRRPRRRRCRRSSRKNAQAHRALRRRRVRDQQGQARALEPRRPAARGARGAARATAHRQNFRRDWSGWHTHLAELKHEVRDELRPREPR